MCAIAFLGKRLSVWIVPWDIHAGQMSPCLLVSVFIPSQISATA